MMITYVICPRYTAQAVKEPVSDVEAMRIAREEKQAYEAAIGGRLGPVDFERASREGVAGIVVRRTEFATGFRLDDLLTADVKLVPKKSRPDFTEHRPVTMHFVHNVNGNPICGADSTQVTLSMSQVRCSACLVKLGLIKDSEVSR